MRRVEEPGQGPELPQNKVVETPTSEPVKSLSAPYSEVYKAEFLEKHPEEKAVVDVIFDEMDRQIVDSYEPYHSETFPGVAFTHIGLKVTPDLIKRVRATDPTSTPLSEDGLKPATSKDQKWFLFTAFSLPPGGDALTVGDLGIDRFMRLLPTVARAMKEGEIPPGAEINLMGAPTGFGGEVTQGWVDAVKSDGFDAYGKLYAEYVKKHVPEDPTKLDNIRIVLQGVSKGTIVADSTYNNLPENVRARTQELIDNPAGNHKSTPLLKYFSSLKVLGGLVGETVVRVLGDSTMKQLMAKDKAFHDALLAQKGIPPDSPEQTKLKKSAVMHEGMRLLSGTPLDTEDNRMFIRRSIFDPLTFNPLRALSVYRETGRQIETISQKLAKREDEFKKVELEELQKEAQRTKMSPDELKARASNIMDRPNQYQAELEQTGQEFPKEKARQPISARQKGKALEVGIKSKGHFFSLYQNWRRWKQNIDYVKSAIPTPIPQQTAV